MVKTEAKKTSLVVYLFSQTDLLIHLLIFLSITIDFSCTWRLVLEYCYSKRLFLTSSRYLFKFCSFSECQGIKFPH